MPELSSRQESPSVDRNRERRLEIGAVLVVMLAPTIASLGCWLIWGSEYRTIVKDRDFADLQSATAFDSATFYSIVVRLRWVPVLLFVMWRSGESWSRFGLVKLDLAKDLLIGVGLWLVVATLSALLEAVINSKHPWAAMLPDSVPGFRTVLLLGESCAIGFAEELGFRAYLIPRVEVVTGSTRKAVLFSVLAFGIAHFSKGFVGVLHSLIAATVWSIAFCSTRRIWPVAIAHAFGDFILMTRIGAMVGKLPM